MSALLPCLNSVFLTFPLDIYIGHKHYTKCYLVLLLYFFVVLFFLHHIHSFMNNFIPLFYQLLGTQCVMIITLHQYQYHNCTLLSYYIVHSPSLSHLLQKLTYFFVSSSFGVLGQ